MNSLISRMAILLDDIQCKPLLFPFAQVQSPARLRIGMLTILEKWEQFFPGEVLLLSEAGEMKTDLRYPANLLPSYHFLKTLASKKELLAPDDSCKTIAHAADIFRFNDWALRQDFERLTAVHKSAPIPNHVQAVGKHNIFLEEGAKLSFAMLNAEKGPVYISKGAEIMEGAALRGPVFIGENSVVKMGAKIYGSTSIGPYCLAGGEIKNSVFFGFSNKAHEGYLGDSVIGSWCNLGAGTSNSNLKNNAGPVTVWHNEVREYKVAGIKCGLLMGDYSRSAINTSFNTGTVVGISCNIAQDGFPPKFIPNFTWCGERYLLDKVLQDIQNWKKLKGAAITPQEIKMITELYQQKIK